MRNPIESMEIQKKILKSRGAEKSNLLGVLKQALHHNAANTYHLGMMVGLMQGDDNAVYDSVTARTALVDRHVIDAQKALEEIYSKAKEKGCREITDIFERTYFVGHSSDK